jgi:hypothetical protein
VLGAFALVACGKGATTTPPDQTQNQPPPDSVDASKISLTYDCENRFKIDNSNSASVVVDWTVQNSGDQGELTLPLPTSGQTFSETVFTTHAVGTVLLTMAGQQIASAANTQLSCSTSSSELVNVTVDPPSANLPTGTSLQFTAVVTGDSDTAVRWSVKEGASGGAVTATGVYTAPSSPGTFHVVATSHADPTKSATAPVTVSVSDGQTVQIVADATSATVPATQTQQFTAQVTGNADTAVLWSVEEGDVGGGVDPTGLYGAPGKAGTFHVIARSHADSSKEAVIAVTVTAQPAPNISVDINPPTAAVVPGGTTQFFAQALYASSNAVTWSVREGAAGGSVNASGVYAAPAVPGTYHVTAISVADQFAQKSATVTVTPNIPAGTGPGKWGPVQPWPLVPIEVALLKNGDVLAWSRLEQPYVWHPGTNSFTQVPSPSWEFCAGLTVMQDGRVIVPGGHINDNYGLPDVNVFDPVTSTWSSAPPMAAGRWYPTIIEMADGGLLVAAGNTADAVSNLIPEVRNADGTWRELTTASLEIPFFPSLFPAPNGLVFMAGSDPHSKFLDASGTGRWIDGPRMLFGARDYGAAVMYTPGKILMAGGGFTPTASAEVIDLNAATPAWRFTGSMAHARRQVTGTVLPDGKVLITGGTSAPGFDNESGAVYSAELWDPATEVFTELASERVLRVYHSTALLMPDATVLVGGGGQGGGGTDEPNVEVFSPPYLFNADGSPAARPSISAAPADLSYGSSFTVSTPNAAQISSVVLVRNGAVTHTYNTTQLRVTASFNAAPGNLTVTAPSNRNSAPPGYYMLFLLDNHGVPSVARIVHLG